jgi:hypothetical protein
MKNFIAISTVFSASSLMFGCAGAGLMPSNTASATRGAVVAHGPAVKAVVQGPTVIHAFAMEAGGGLYAVPVVTGADSDCAMAPPAGSQERTAILPDHRMVMTVNAGQMACLVTSKTRNFELLWHADVDEAVGLRTELALATRANRLK